MAQISTIQATNLDSMLASQCSKVGKEKSDFSKIFASSNNQTNQQRTESQTASSIHTTKEKLENTVSSSKNLLHSDKYETESTQGEASKELYNNEQGVVDDIANSVLQLKKEIAKILDISVDELEKVMSESGILAVDLLNPEMLQNIFLQVNHVNESTDLLTNETLCDQLQVLVKKVEEFKETVDVETLLNSFEEMVPETFSEILEGKDQSSEGKAELESAEFSSEAKPDALSSNEPVITVQKKEMAGEKNNGFHKEQSKQEQDFQQTQLNQFVQNLADSIQQTNSVEMESMERLQQMQDIVNQVVEKIKVTLSNDTTSMEMQLNPGNLGRVTVSVISKNGEMTAAFTVENQLAKEALESQMLALKENLNEQGIKVEAIEVTVAEQGLSQEQFSSQTGQSFQQNKRRGNVNKLHNMDDNQELEEEAEAVQAVTVNGTVDFSA